MAAMNHIAGPERNRFRAFRVAAMVPCLIVNTCRAPPQEEKETMEDTAAGRAGLPWLTLALLAALIAVFAAEVAPGLDPPSGPAGFLEPSLRTLSALGGSNWTLVVERGEWWRLVSAPFLHLNLLHLALNGLVLLWGGWLVERTLGRAWFAAIYAVSAVCGVVVSLAINPPSVVSVGASGALMGLMASLFVASFHFEPGPVRARLRITAMQVLIPSLIPIGITGGRVDIGAHIGGALGGALMALILVGHWPAAARRPGLQWFAAAIGLAGLTAAAVTAGKAGSAFLKAQHETAVRALLIPNSQLPRTDGEWKAQAAALADRYPRDPRPRLFRGATLLDAGDLAGAERELRAGLADVEMFGELLPPQVETLLRTNLAVGLYGDGRRGEARAGARDEAKAIAAPVCRLDTAESRAVRTRLRRMGVCE
jgi:rhomboid protease GluP